MKKYHRRILPFFSGALIGILVIVILAISWYLSTFLSTAGLSFGELKTIVSDGFVNREQYKNTTITFLILGLDKREDGLESTLLTDTIILASLDIPTNKLTMIPIPRDLWIDELKTKVNSLYYYGEKRDNTTGPEFTEAELEKITGQRIDSYFVMNYNNLPTLVDLVGGIDIDVAQSFTDNEYPNPNYLIDQSQPIYQTVQFNNGLQHLDGKRALEFVRSRHSDSDEGSDISRSKRQLQVFNGIIKKLSSRSLVTNPQKMGMLYRFWADDVDSNMTDETIISIGLSTDPSVIAIHSVSIPVGIASDQEAILINPPTLKHGLWVWEPKDTSWRELKEFIKTNL